MSLKPYQREFIDFVLRLKILRFGQFTLKSGRLSPYFFNSGLFNTGSTIGQLGRFYAAAIDEAALHFDLLYGPAYKGIPLAVTTAIALNRDFRKDTPFCFNRKEAKDHGESGITVGAPLQGRVLIIDDVISAGTSVRESVDLIRQHGATPCGVVIALDRQERGLGEHSAVQELQDELQLTVTRIIGLADLLEYLNEKPEMAQIRDRVDAYRQQYGAR